MIEATATTNTQENPLILSHLESYRTLESDFPLHVPFWRGLYDMKRNEWASKSSISANVVLPESKTINETTSIKESEFSAVTSRTHENQEESLSDSFLDYPAKDERIVSMPPRREYTITLKVESLSRAEPNIVEPNSKAL